MGGRERLDMDQTNKPSNVTFKQKKGYFVQRWVIVSLVAVAALCLLLVGLLVGYLRPCPRTQHLQNEDETTDKPKQHPYVLLPRSVVPEHYEVALQPFVTPGNFTFAGRVKILLRVLEDTDNVTVHVNDLTVERDSVRLTSVQGHAVPGIGSVSEDKLREFYVLHLDSRLSEGRYELEMRFKGNLNDQLSGFYRSHYVDKEGNKRWLATTQFQPTDARRAFPCFDEPGLKATFNLSIIRRKNMTSMSNMPILRSEERDDDWVEDVFEKTVRMSTYLLAFIVSDFERRGTEQYHFSVWSRPEAINTTSYALEIGPKMLEFYEQFFDTKYPLPKMDMAAIPDFSAGAMENWGLITYRETALLYDPRYASARNKLRVATVVAHELAHQWFGNLVTPKWWDDLWLNEGFASYVEYLGITAVHPDWMMDQQFVVDDLQDVMDLDALRTSHPISVPVGHPDEINEIFDRISYGKGATIIRMMNYFLGNTTFQKGVSNYLQAKKFDNAVQDDLWAHLTDAQTQSEKINVKTVMDSWTLQTGYPVLNIIRNYAAGTADITQTRFVLDQNNTNRPSEIWEVPLTYTDNLNLDWTPTTKKWLHKTNGTISGLPKDQWVIANVQQAGYYKVNYDMDNWKMLLNQLTTDHTRIHTVNRAQILDDTMDLARAGLLSYDVALNATIYLSKETEYLPWRSALISLGQINSMLSRSSIYGIWRKYMLKQLQPLYDMLGWTEQSDEDILKQFLRTNVLSWLCSYGHKDCVQKAQEMFGKWQKDPSDLTLISPNLRSVVYCTAVRFGSEETWDFLWKEYKEAKVASEKDKYMNALACSQEPWLLSRYLNWSLSSNSGIRKQDGSSVFQAVGSKLYGRDLTFNYLRDKWDHIFNIYGKSFFAISTMLKSVTYSLNTQFECNQLKEFYKKKRNNLGASKRAFEQSIEKAEANVRWMENNFDYISNWLKSVEIA